MKLNLLALVLAAAAVACGVVAWLDDPKAGALAVTLAILAHAESA